MIFEFSIDPHDRAVHEEYERESARLRGLLPQVDGFLGVQRFVSEHDPGAYVAIGYFRDETAVAAWRNSPDHRRAQALGRRRLFTGYRLRMAAVVRDYGPQERDQAPDDSRQEENTWTT